MIGTCGSNLFNAIFTVAAGPEVIPSISKKSIENFTCSKKLDKLDFTESTLWLITITRSEGPNSKFAITQSNIGIPPTSINGLGVEIPTSRNREPIPAAGMMS